MWGNRNIKQVGGGCLQKRIGANLWKHLTLKLHRQKIIPWWLSSIDGRTPFEVSALCIPFELVCSQEFDSSIAPKELSSVGVIVSCEYFIIICFRFLEHVEQVSSVAFGDSRKRKNDYRWLLILTGMFSLFQKTLLFLILKRIPALLEEK